MGEDEEAVGRVSVFFYVKHLLSNWVGREKESWRRLGGRSS
jgi:hypothetical protein